MITHPIVILGSGLAGYNVARELRKLDKQIPLTLISADGAHFYSKPMLSSALASKKTPESIPMNTAEQMAAQLGADVRPRTHVTAIDTARHAVHIGHESAHYSKLVLAIGADQIRLPLTGSAADRVLSVNNLDDYARFREAIHGRHDIAIVGAGLIGCEFAQDLSSTGHKVDVIDLANQPLPRLLPPAGGALLKSRLEANGVTWHLGTSVKSIDADGTRVRITLENGTVLGADVVLSAVGLKPRTALAATAGLAIKRGIVVNRRLETSAADVYALGDCAEVEGLVLPFVMPIMHAARALAATLAGKPTAVAYPAMPVLVKTPACPTVVSPPVDPAAGTWEISAADDSVKSLFKDKSGKLLGFALNGKATSERAALTQQLPPLLA
jgi:rubredoxin-NAD+ reductase